MKQIIAQIAVPLLGLAGLCIELRGQNTAILIDSDIRIFTVLATLHAGGYDYDFSHGQPVRLSMAKEFQNISPRLRERIQKFYQDHSEGQKPEEQLSKYISLALLCEGPPEFKLALPLVNLPPDAQSVYGFLDLVKELYTQAKIEVVWSKYRAYYDQTILRYRPIINQIIFTTDGYLRIASGSFLDRRLTFIPEFLVPSNTFNARNYRENYYLVFGPSEKLKTAEIRHQYLHFILDPFALRFTLPRDTRIALSKFVENAPGIEDPYRKDLQFLVTESLIRAIELRINKIPAVKASAELDSYIRAGALLSRHFYESLQTFEEGQEGIRLYYPGIVKTIEPETIEASFNAAVKAPVEKPPELSEVQKLLKEANSNLGDNDLEKARELFETVLTKYDTSNGEALYGLGVVASIQNDRESAKECFQKALESSTSDKPIRVWSHIYLGRLHDVEGRRKEALSQYQAAIDLGDNTRNAQEVANRGLKEPFSSKKRSPVP